MKTIIKSLSLEKTETGGLRALVYKSDPNGFVSVDAIVEAEHPGDLAAHLREHHSDVMAVRLPDGTIEIPDCLSPFEAAEAAMLS